MNATRNGTHETLAPQPTPVTRQTLDRLFSIADSINLPMSDGCDPTWEQVRHFACRITVATPDEFDIGRNAAQNVSLDANMDTGLGGTMGAAHHVAWVAAWGAANIPPSGVPRSAAWRALSLVSLGLGAAGSAFAALLVQDRLDPAHFNILIAPAVAAGWVDSDGNVLDQAA